MAEVRNIDTRERILDAAERLFMAHGYDGTSMRMITGEAAVNLAAVNYHFGSKEMLMKEVFRRRLGWLNEERLRVLDEMEAPPPAMPLKPSQIVDGFFGTLLRMGERRESWRHHLPAPARPHADRTVGVHPHLLCRRIRRSHRALQGGAVQGAARRAEGGDRLALPFHARRDVVRHRRHRCAERRCRLGNRRQRTYRRGGATAAAPDVLPARRPARAAAAVCNRREAMRPTRAA